MENLYFEQPYLPKQQKQKPPKWINKDYYYNETHTISNSHINCLHFRGGWGFYGLGGCHKWQKPMVAWNWVQR